MLLLFQQIGYVGQQCEVACTLDCHGEFSLEFERGSCDAPRQDFTLLVEEFFEELGILVIDVLDAVLLEAAILLLLDFHCGGGQKPDFTLLFSHN
jgi:hypothetical protein